MHLAPPDVVRLGSEPSKASGMLPQPFLPELDQPVWSNQAAARLSLGQTTGPAMLSRPTTVNNRRIIRLVHSAHGDAVLRGESPSPRVCAPNFKPEQPGSMPDAGQVLARYGLFLTAAQIEMPVDVAGAEFLLVCPCAANARIPNGATKLMAILNAAGISYTVSARLMEMNTEGVPLADHREHMQRLLVACEQEAERLQVQKLLVVEYGCATRSLFTNTSQVLGRPFRVPIIIGDALILAAIETGALPVEQLDIPITLHDPCHFTQGAESGQVLRTLLRIVTRTFIEMIPDRKQSHCCKHTSPDAVPSEQAPTQRREGVLKARQIWDTGATYVATPCILCMLHLEDICQLYGLRKSGQRMALMLFEVVYEAMYRALARRGELARLSLPAELLGRDDAFFAQHSIAGTMASLVQAPNAIRILEWLEYDEAVKRHARNHPEVLEQLARFKALVCASRWLDTPLKVRAVGG